MLGSHSRAISYDLHEWRFPQSSLLIHICTRGDAKRNACIRLLRMLNSNTIGLNSIQ